MSRFDAHADMLENRLELSGEVMDDGLFTAISIARATFRFKLIYSTQRRSWGQNFDSHFGQDSTNTTLSTTMGTPITEQALA